MLGLTIMGLQHVPPTIKVEDQVRVSDLEVTCLSARQSRSYRGGAVAMTSQAALSALNPLIAMGYQVAEAVRAHGAVRRRAARERAIKVAGHVGIPNPESRYTACSRELSGDTRQRVMMAMAIGANPAAPTLDEPTTALERSPSARLTNGSCK